METYYLVLEALSGYVRGNIYTPVLGTRAYIRVREGAASAVLNIMMLVMASSERVCFGMLLLAAVIHFLCSSVAACRAVFTLCFWYFYNHYIIKSIHTPVLYCCCDEDNT